MKKIFVFVTVFNLTIVPIFADDLIKIKCDCVYGLRENKDVKTQTILSTDESLINKKSIQYFYIDDKKKEIYDEEMRKRNAIIFTKDKIYIFDVTKVNESLTNGEIYNIDRNEGLLEGSIVFEILSDGRLVRNTTQIYGSCSKVDSQSKF